MAITALVAAILSSCATTVHAPEAFDPFAAADDERPRAPSRALAQYTRRVRPAHNVDVVATLWDPAMLVAEAQATGTPTTAGLLEDAGDARDRLERWRTQYLEDQTTFTVVLELANRPGPPARTKRHTDVEAHADDPLVLPKSWSFTLDRGAEEGIEPRRVEVQAVDRFPTRAGGYHYRIAYAVHFAGAPIDRASATQDSSSTLKLRVRPLIRDRTGTGVASGSSRRGFVIKWWLQPASP